ncbi:hypothetical protein OW763_15520 [Clostridium aestuarii]|uniref:Uncharacterized protein n=1 Tax=Clostridium aestuarii TaxID=338193 RepID=A0ABT4D3C2_9CLOT|nr:hypothetical protein [Clostridium aestuarii]MCY6485733.1 hypothetical protein [Clostridium aestuarii]
MGRLIKYELKGNFKFFLGLFIIMILLTFALYSRIDVWSSVTVYVLESLAITAMFVTILIVSINSFSKEMYQER